MEPLAYAERVIMTDVYRNQVDRLLSTIAQWSDAYTSTGFSYLGVRNGSGWTLLHGRLFLSAEPLSVSGEVFRTERIIAGHVPLPISKNGHRSLIEALYADGAIDVPLGRLVLPREASGQISAHYTPFHPEGLSSQNRLPVLVIQGGSRHGLFEQPSVD